MKKKQTVDVSRQVDDGYGSTMMCARIDCDLEVVRPGKVQCRGEYDSLGCPATHSDLVAAIKNAVDAALGKT